MQCAIRHMHGYLHSEFYFSFFGPTGAEIIDLTNFPVCVWKSLIHSECFACQKVSISETFYLFRRNDFSNFDFLLQGGKIKSIFEDFFPEIRSKIILSFTLRRGRRTPEKQTDFFLSWSSSRCTTVKCCLLFSWFSIGINLLNFIESSTRVNQCGKLGYSAALFVWTV